MLGNNPARNSTLWLTMHDIAPHTVSTMIRKTEQISVRLAPAVRDLLEKKAAEERRNVSDYVRILIERDLGEAA